MHGRYRRRLVDVALGGAGVVVELVVRRFRCSTPGSPPSRPTTSPTSTASPTACAATTTPSAPGPQAPGA
ncbi:hypothetical protein [Frankia sp. Cj3]|uniref:hypothetical protein n=1 Tax=Frankia sp. Cj3 TaxID=2880976 RepID=UPI001EF62AEF|nr:hypothetical protein [Frankia sp. Cj3]